jgi:hypothetical protein
VADLPVHEAPLGIRRAGRQIGQGWKRIARETAAIALRYSGTPAATGPWRLASSAVAPVVTRDATRYRTYFPGLEIAAP